MLSRDSLSTGLLVTVVTVLVWYIAARETREQRPLETSVVFEITGEGRWTIEPRQAGASVLLEGSRHAIDQAEEVLSSPRLIALRAEMQSELPVDLLERLREDQGLQATGVEVVSVEPRAVPVKVDRIREVQARIRHRLPPTIQFETVEFDPPTVTLEMPGRAFEHLRGANEVEAIVDPAQLAGLEPGVWNKRPARLVLPLDFPVARELVTLTPPTATMSIKVSSQTRTTTRDDVRVQLAGPHEDFSEFDIEIDPSVLKGVTIEAEGDIVDQIEAGTAHVVAVLHLSNRDKSTAIKSKRIAYYLVLGDQIEGGSRIVRSTSPPREIALTITRR